MFKKETGQTFINYLNNYKKKEVRFIKNTNRLTGYLTGGGLQ